jgi:hypothetical protein
VWHDLGKGTPGAYEWFYFDLMEDDGTHVSVSLLAPNPFDLSPYVALPPAPRCPQCAPPNLPAPGRHVGTAVHVSVPGEPPNVRSVQEVIHLDDGDPRMSFCADPWSLRVGGATVSRTSGTLPTYTLEFNVTAGPAQASGSLTFKAIQPEWMVPDCGLLFQQQTDGDHWHRWAVHAPRATVSGQYQITALDPKFPARSKTVVNADGYHDHNWGSHRPADAFQRWTWARGSAGERAVVAASLVPATSSGYNDLRVSSIFAVMGTAGVSTNLFRVVPDPTPAALPFAKVIDVGYSPTAGAYRAVFQHDRIALEFASVYQRRIAKLELYDPAGGAPVDGMAVAETLLPQAVP